MIGYYSLSYVLLCLLALNFEVHGLCYFPNHEVAVNDTACTTNGASVCCQQGAACLDNGLCYLPSASAVGGFIRGSCTDQSWASLDCPQYCTYDIPGGIFNSLSDAGVVSCGSNQYCCESANITTCDCQTGNGTFTLPGAISAYTTIGLSSTTTSSSTLSTTSTTSYISTSILSSLGVSSTTSTETTSAAAHIETSSAATSTSTSTALSNGSSETVKVGVAVGVPLGVALLVVIGIFTWKGRRLPSSGARQVEISTPLVANKNPAWSSRYQHETYELPLTERSGANAYELPVK